MSENKILTIRDTVDYADAMNDIGGIIDKYRLNYVEAYGVLESVKDELHKLEEKEE